MIHLEELNFSKIYSISEHAKFNKISGIYRLYNKDMKLMYIGKAKFIGARVKQHSTGDKGLNHNYFFFDFCELNCPVDREIYETYYINLLMPPINRDKTFLYDSTVDKFFSEDYKKEIEKEEEEMRKKMNDFYL